MSSNVNPTAKFAILDCDGGSDDAWALLLLLHAEKAGHLKLLAVTVTGCGNTTCENAARNMRRILKVSSREDIPIYLGAVEPIICNNVDKKYFHGCDGFGDCLKDTDLQDVSTFVESKHAVNAIRDLCEERPQQITIIMVGPLTNLALGYTMYGEQFGGNIKDIYIMGGNYQGMGNSSRAAEFNFHSDPEAAHAVLLKTRCPITILPWEACTKDYFNISINWRLDDFGKRSAVLNHLAIKMLTEVETAQWMPMQQYGFDNWNPCDALIVATWLFDKQFVRKDSFWHATVELNGTHTRGQMVLDHLREETKFPSNVRIIEKVDDFVFKQIVEWIAGLRDEQQFSICGPNAANLSPSDR
ncbi:nucleoside hydrolase [Drosophila sulfurigaster albostrigata]|uniref:nucleoside hydrolase n=1 Tax=Drosophila sulfurigaster albostrigata TaxID=89887 RepID=UPI002D21847D|nr:nucleoside hydrolase [Drosophila sulfurigaster albostrigata]XP_062140423.1 nucleoside hydrolase [Drosophila sulfurigaster albostrigata]